MSQNSSFRWQHLALLVLLAFLIFFAGLGRLPLLEPDEGRNAEVAREMLASGDWITPHFDSLVYLDKPAVFFSLVAASFRSFGVCEWAARLPSALLGMATLVLVWALGRRAFGDVTGLRAGIILATSPLAIVEARLVGLDMALTFLVAVAMMSFWLAETDAAHPAWQHALLFGAMGLATITKGPVGFLLPLLSILAYLALRGRVRELGRLRWGLGGAVFLGVALPWFVAASLRNPGFLHYAFWQESLARFATGQSRRTGSLLYYIPVYFAGFFPWSLFLLFAGWHAAKRWRALGEEAQKPVAFCLAWAGVVFLFFTVSRSKLPAYFLPALVPLSLLMAKVWEAEAGQEGRPSDWVTAGFAALIALGLLVALTSRWLPLDHHGTGLGGLPALAPYRAGPAGAGLGARLARRLHPDVLALVRPSMLFSGLILTALAWLGRNLATRGKSRASASAVFALVALMVPLLFIRWMPAVRIFSATTSSRQLAKLLRSSPEKDLPLYGYYYFRTSLPFYLGRPVGLVTAGGGELTSNYVSTRFAALRSATLPGGLPLFVDPAGLAALAEHQSVLVITRNTHVSSLAHAVGRLEPMWEGWGFSVWKISKAP